jgi:hypothetical protein
VKSTGNKIHKMLNRSPHVLDQPRARVISTAVSTLPTFTVPLLTRQLIGRLLNQATGAPLVGFTVHVFDLDAGTQLKDLGYDLTDAKGVFKLVYIASSPTLPKGGNNGRYRSQAAVADPG